MNIRIIPVVVLAVAAACLPFVSCSDSSTEPEAEILKSFSLGVPDTVIAGEGFSLAVAAVGSEGTKPFASFDGTVILTVSGGAISPDSLELIDGSGSGQVVLSGSDASQTITATYGSVTGSVTVNAELMTVLEGDPDDSANEAIPGFPFIANGDDYSDGHPSLGSMYVSHNTVMLSFTPGATVSDANAVLSGTGAKIVGGVTGVDGEAQGILFLKLPTATHAELESVMNTLDARPAVLTVVQDVLMGPDETSRPNDGDPSTWTWERTPAGANWGLERIRVPQMWNLNAAVAKKRATEAFSAAAVLIVDTGFSRNHPDVYTATGREMILDSHGAHVSGIIGARYDNGRGIDGICPDVFMMGKSVVVGGGSGAYLDRMSVGEAVISGLYWNLRAYTDIVNISLGYNWADAGIDSDTDPLAQNIVMKHEQLFVRMLHLSSLSYRSPLIVCSAGNDSGRGFGDQDARYNSPMCYAALGTGIENILVVEGVMDSPGTGAGDVTRYPSSSVGGHVSAPGADVWGTTSTASYYRGGDGTSYAAAMVTGLAACISNVEPYLSYWEIIDVIQTNALSSGGGAQPRIDAWASVIDIDRVRSGTMVLGMMCDIDDGTLDGNQRVVCADGSAYFGEDADIDGGVGDGNIDMSDFRRWRDWYLLSQTAVEFDLDGSASHPKKDVNGNSVIEGPAGENIYPRGDFNGDGILSETALSYVPGAIGGDATDLEVLMEVFDDPDHAAGELPGLVESFDFTLDLTFFFTESGMTSVPVRAWYHDGTPYWEYVMTAADPVKVFTEPCDPQGYYLHLYMDGTMGAEYFEFGHDASLFSMEPGADVWLEPIGGQIIDPKISFLHVCSDGALDAPAHDLAAHGILPGDWILIDQLGSYEGGGGWHNLTNMHGAFSSSDILLSGDQLNRVPGAIDAGEDIWTIPTFNCGGETTDIAEDFDIDPYVIIQVPAGARYIFLAPNESKYEDNYNDGGYGVQISKIRMKGYR
jgi:hypothetical protein